jgi:hypothetical protein
MQWFFNAHAWPNEIVYCPSLAATIADPTPLNRISRNNPIVRPQSPMKVAFSAQKYCRDYEARKD